jgi:hypothetical protein
MSLMKLRSVYMLKMDRIQSINGVTWKIFRPPRGSK